MTRQQHIQRATPGGERLKFLRESLGRTQLEVELDAHLGTGYLQRVESGKVQHPECETVQRILNALGVGYAEQREVLAQFGYRIHTPLPSKVEIAWAVDACHSELHSAVFPAYLLDCTHQMRAWNAFVPYLFPISFLGKTDSISLVRLLFNPQYGVLKRILNKDAFFSAQLRAFRLEMQPFVAEPWCDILLQSCRLDEMFEHFWQRTASENPNPLAARPLVPLHILDIDGSKSLQFRLLSEPFAQDQRFRLIYYLPADPVTMQWCLDITSRTTVTESETK